jgi:hypothetical protein
MLVATFNESTGWNGRAVTRVGDSFDFDGQGELRAADLVCYWHQGHLAWASREACVGAVDSAATSYEQDARALARHMKDASVALQRAEAHGRAPVATLPTTAGKVFLYEDRIETSQGSSWLSPAVNATVDTAGNLTVQRRATLARMTTGALLLGPFGMIAGGMLKKKARSDDRELYLLIETPDFVGLFPCDPKRGAVVRQFAAQIRSAVLRQPQLEQERLAYVAAAQAALSAALAAEVGLQQVGAALDAARAALQPVPA